MYRGWAESVFFFFFCFLVSNDGNTADNTNSQNISYDVSKLVDFPGFNVPAPHKMKDVSPTIESFQMLYLNMSLVIWVQVSVIFIFQLQ